MPGAVPSGYDPAYAMFLQYVDMSLYGGAQQQQSGVFPNPPMGAPADDEDGDGEDMTEYLKRRIAYLESGRAKTTTYTFDEYMRHLDKVLGG